MEDPETQPKLESGTEDPVKTAIDAEESSCIDLYVQGYDGMNVLMLYVRPSDLEIKDKLRDVKQSIASYSVEQDVNRLAKIICMSLSDMQNMEGELIKKVGSHALENREQVLMQGVVQLAYSAVDREEISKRLEEMYG